MYNHLKYLISLFSILFIFFISGPSSVIFASTPQNFQQDDSTRILLLSANYRGFQWVESIIDGLESSFKNQGVELSIDCLDTERQFDSAYKNAILHLLEAKYSKVPYDLVITSGTNAFHFFLSHGHTIFKGIPHVFCGITDTDFDSKMKSKNYSCTGITAKMDVYNNLRLIESLHPDCRKIVIIADNTTVGKTIQEDIQKIPFEKNPNPVIEVWSDVSIGELKRKLISLDSDTVVLYGIFFRDKNGHFLEAEVSTKLVSRFSPVPVYAGYDFAIGSGIVGGYLVKGNHQGRVAGKLAMRILKDNIAPKDIPVIVGTSALPEFDWRALYLFKIAENKLPPNSTIYFRPKPFYEKYKKIISGTVLISILFLVGYLILFIAFKRVKRSEKDLKSQTIQMKNFLDFTEEGIISLDENWKVVSLNLAAEKLTGWSQEDAAGIDIEKVFHIIDPDTGNFIGHEIKNDMEQPASSVLLRRKILIAKDKTQFQIAYSVSYMAHWDDPNENTFIGAILVFRDIGEEYKLFKISRKNETISRKIFNKTSNGILLISKESQLCMDANQTALDIIELPRTQLNGLHMQNISSILMDRWQRLAESDSSSDQVIDFGQIVYHTKNKKRKILTILMIDLDHDLFALLIQDISQRIEMERQIRESQKIEALGTLSCGIAHDFNNILTSLFAHTSLLEINDADSDIFKKSLAQIDSGLKRAADIVRQILTFSRQNESNKIWFDISTVLDDAVKFLHSSIPSSIEIKKDINIKANILGDPTQIHQIVLNLGANAYQAMKDFEKGILSIILENVHLGEEETRHPGNYVKLTISDTGHGILEDDLPRIFDPFFTTKKMGEGTGLGLSVVDGIVKNHNGWITVKSKKNEGTQFDIFFPIHEHEENDSLFSSSIIEESVFNPLSSSGNILLVDDEKEILFPIKSILEQYGFPTTIAEDALTAMDVFAQDPDGFDCCIIDVIMPQINGLELAAKLLEIRSDVKIILCSGLVDEKNKEKALELGISTILEKPLAPQKLLAHIEKLLVG